MNSWSRIRGVVGWATYRVIGLMFMLISAFSAVVTLSWVIAVLVDYLRSIHPFHSVAFRLLAAMEVGVLYVFTFVCGVLVTIGVFRMLLRSLEDR